MVLSSFGLSGKTALVTGCNKGIGKSMAIGLAEAGADIIGVSGSLSASGSDIQTEVEKLGRMFTAYQANLSGRQALYAFIQQVQTNHPVVDILDNNAGTIMRKPAAEHPDDYWDTVLSLNLDAPFVLAREFGKKMLERGSG
ncbi:MAG TPA: SDR family NAD(P)-dependent oxidoreductase, partial [Chitinophagaceae bacterium]|nr:SDR family NAD(P)-dependent oxidoreductase [Chitinophagaceae bacterium]